MDANGANGPPRILMMSIADIAARDGVSKPTVSNHVKRLVERSGLSVERDGLGRVARVNVAEYDHLRGITADPSKAQAPRASAAAAPALSVDPSETYDEALRQKTWHEAEKRRLELAEIKGRLIRIERLEDAVRQAGEAIVHVLDGIPSWADELATAVAREGSHGLRTALKARSATLRNAVASALDDLATLSPATDEDDGPPAS